MIDRDYIRKVFLSMTEDTKEYPTTRQSESKVMPPPDPEIRFPDVAVIPPGQKSVVIIPKGPEVKLPIKEANDQPNGVKTVVDLPK
jgi:hypothetical protein